MTAPRLPKDHPLRCSSCGEKATTTTVLEGFRTPVCLRHYNVWKTPTFAPRLGETPDIEAVVKAVMKALADAECHCSFHAAQALAPVLAAAVREARAAELREAALNWPGDMDTREARRWLELRADRIARPSPATRTDQADEATKEDR